MYGWLDSCEILNLLKQINKAKTKNKSHQIIISQ